MPVKAAQEPSSDVVGPRTCPTCKRGLAAPATTVQRERARKNRYKQIGEKLAVVGLLASDPGIVAHLTEKDAQMSDFWAGTVCVHHPSAGQLRWKVTAEDIKHYFGHLPIAPCEWDGHTHDVKHDRVMDYLDALPRAPR